MYGQSTIRQDLRNTFRDGNVILVLIVINVAVFLVMNLGEFVVKAILDRPDLEEKWESFFVIPSDTGALLKRPYTIITHMFSHGGILHILFNMLWLFWMGRILREFAGNRIILPVYIYSGLMGALFFVAAYNFLPGLKEMPVAVGASAAVMGIITATATLMPNYTIFLFIIGPVRLKWLALFAVMLDLVGINGSNAGGSIAHLGGALMGVLFITARKNGFDLAQSINKPADFLGRIFFRKKGPRLYYKKEKVRTVRTSVSKPTSINKQEQLDIILDKIAQSGYDSLSKEEKDFLFRVSKEE